MVSYAFVVDQLLHWPNVLTYMPELLFSRSNKSLYNKKLIVLTLINLATLPFYIQTTYWYVFIIDFSLFWSKRFHKISIRIRYFVCNMNAIGYQCKQRKSKCKIWITWSITHLRATVIGQKSHDPINRVKLICFS